ncbi:MAG: DUF4369 domain-containing protein, partial [Salinimicrobium sp.]
MKKFGFVLMALLILAACSNEEKNLTINGRVQGLKKGTLYLQKIEDTALVNIDSVKVNGDENFNFETFIESPQVLYLYLNKVDNNKYDDRVLFFAEPGEMTVSTTLRNFETDVIVEGSENQKKLVQYQDMMKQFNQKNLDLIKKNLEAQQNEDQASIDSTTSAYDNLLKRRYLYT